MVAKVRLQSTTSFHSIWDISVDVINLCFIVCCDLVNNLYIVFIKYLQSVFLSDAFSFILTLKSPRIITGVLGSFKTVECKCFSAFMNLVIFTSDVER